MATAGCQQYEEKKINIVGCCKKTTELVATHSVFRQKKQI